MKKHTHNIQKQWLIFDFSTDEKARHWHSTASAFYYHEILPLLNRTLEKYHLEGYYCFIQSLEIDLGLIDEQELQETIIYKIEAELNRILKSISPHNILNPLITGPEEKNQFGTIAFTKEMPEHLLEIFFFFLDEGILPWNCGINSLAMFEAELKKEIGLEKLASHPDFQKRLNQIQTRRRLYYQFSRSFWVEVCNYLFPSELANLYSIQKALISVLKFVSKNTKAQKQLRQELAGDLNEWLGITAATKIQAWPQEYISWMIEKALPYVQPRGKSTVSKAILQVLSTNNKKLQCQHHNRQALVKALEPLLSSEFFRQEFKNNNKLEHSMGLLSPLDTSWKEEPKPEVPETKNPNFYLKIDSKKNFTDKTSPPTKIPEQYTKKFNQKQAPDEQTAKESLANLISQEVVKEKVPVEPAELPDYRFSNAEQDHTVAFPSENRELKEGGKLPNQGGNKTKREDTHTFPFEKKQQKGEEKLLNQGKVKAEREESRIFPLEKKKQKGEEKMPNQGGVKAEKEEPHFQHPWPSDKEQGKDRVEDKEVSNLGYRNILPEYYLRHAGVILNWPYLARLFRNVNYLNGNVFNDEQSQQRAVHLVAYLASGQEQCDEPELLIAKFLCDWPLQMPIMKTLTLTKKEKKEANQMLVNLIANWSILKNTSVDGLRSSFFNRDGKLLREDEYWRLLIEQKSYDMLLEHLPYTISIIKLPWMKRILKVDWA